MTQAHECPSHGLLVTWSFQVNLVQELTAWQRGAGAAAAAGSESPDPAPGRDSA
jgi:hypothetical protein